MARDEDFHACLRRHTEGMTFTVGAMRDEEALREIWELSRGLPHNFSAMMRRLRWNRGRAAYEVMLPFAMGLLTDRVAALAADPPEELFELHDIALPEVVYARVARQCAKHPDPRMRRASAMLVRTRRLDDVALPLAPGEPWDPTGWRRGMTPRAIHTHASGTRRQQDVGVPPLATIAELRELLGVASPAQLGFFLLASDSSDLEPYHTFYIPKRSGGARLIAAPCEDLLHTQRAILSEILSKLPTHPAAHGFVPGRSTVTNAAPHVGKRVVIKFDLADFFPTLRYWRVVGLFASMGYPVGRLCFATQDEDTEVATTLARLCCYVDDYLKVSRAYAPQGAPTSPAISNLICRTLDKRLHNLAASMDGDYTRYADDLTFSFHDTPPKGIGRFRWWINQICQQEGFVVREDKFRVVRSSQQQRVTGIVVNDSLSIPRKERRRLRAIVHNCERHGLASQARGRPGFASWLLGYASYVKMVHPDEGGDLLARVLTLTRGAP
jgi:retron-type reverse transcriptase